MALISMACYDTEENGRSKFTKRTLTSLLTTVDFNKHSLCVIDNGSCEDTVTFLKDFQKKFPVKENLNVIFNDRNLGTAKAVNQGIRLRKPNQHVVKMDNDVVVETAGWVDEMEECIRRMPKIGLVGLKRLDLEDSPNHTNPYYRSELIMLPHQTGERWLVCERVTHMIGTCQMVASALLDQIGGFEQPSVYGYDDTIICCKSRLLKFTNVYLPHVVAHHIDWGGTLDHVWKIEQAKQFEKQVEKILSDYRRGRRRMYVDVFA